MLINVKELSIGGILEFDLSGSVDAGGVPAQVHASGKITQTEEGYVVKGVFDALVSLKCDLCLESFEKKLEGTLDEVYSNNFNEEKDYWPFEEKMLDMQPAIAANIMLILPMRAVCSDNCKGLCPICGHNLNKGDCGCDREYSNPAFEGLMDLFK